MAGDAGQRGLNWGCGPTLAPGWINSDREQYHDTRRADFHHGDVISGLPWDDGTFDGIVANHSLQSLGAGELDHAVREFHRVLRPGGRFRVLVPDIVAAYDAWYNENESWPGFAAISEPWDLDRKFCHYLTWGGQNRTVFTRSTLLALLGRNGFENYRFGMAPEPWEWLRELDSRLDESIVIEAIA
jgi:predicted SAM-dependent methyltransferase